MIYSVSGKLIAKTRQFAAVDVMGLGIKVLITQKTFQKLPRIGEKVNLLCYFHSSQNGFELYGFFDQQERDVFEMLNSINGIGPKAALKILSEIKAENLLSAIGKGKNEILTKTAGIGVKKASRIILELSDKIKNQKLSETDDNFEVDSELEDVLKTLGYKQKQIREAIEKISPTLKILQERLKASLKILSGR